MFRACILVIAIVSAMQSWLARDDGRYANSPLKPWFENLSSKRGLCCSAADGIIVEDPDWMVVSDVKKPRVHYRVRINGPWIDVPDDAVISEANPVGKAMLWVVTGDFGMSLRCFMPGNMS